MSPDRRRDLEMTLARVGMNLEILRGMSSLELAEVARVVGDLQDDDDRAERGERFAEAQKRRVRAFASQHADDLDHLGLGGGELERRYAEHGLPRGLSASEFLGQPRRR
jgi:hypothetical protein